MATLKELAATAQVVTQVALEKSLIELKAYIDAKAAGGGSEIETEVQALSDKLDALIGAEGGDVDKLLNTFNDIKAFLANYSEDDTLASLISAVNTSIQSEATRATQAEQANATAISNEVTRAQGAENTLSSRITTLENVEVMTAAQAKTLFDSIFTPTQNAGGE